MEMDLLEFKDVDGVEKASEIYYEDGFTDCSFCPLSTLYPATTRTSTCSINAHKLNAHLAGNGPFVDFRGRFFCSNNRIRKVKELASGVGEGFKRQKRKVSLGDLIAKVCPRRCVFMENTDKCTEEYRKCPGCLLDGLNLDS